MPVYLLTAKNFADAPWKEREHIERIVVRAGNEAEARDQAAVAGGQAAFGRAEATLSEREVSPWLSGNYTTCERQDDLDGAEVLAVQR